MNEKLTPCPFCGEKAELWKSAKSFVICNNCAASTRESLSHDTAIKAWNRRSYKGQAFADAFMAAFNAGKEGANIKDE